MQLKHPQGKQGPHLDPTKYQLVHDAILSVLPTEGQGMAYDELCEGIARRVPGKLFPNGVEWYAVSVKLHLEAEGVERIGGPRLRHLRVA